MQDGYEVIDPTEILSRDFDYIIVVSSRYYREIAADAEKIAGKGIKRKVINGEVLYIPGFDFEKYISLRENPISIISNDCFGGILYHYLNLEFSSPFINCAIAPDDFLLLANSLEGYMKQPLLMEQEGDIYQCPVGTLTHLHNKIRIYFNHAYSFGEAKRILRGEGTGLIGTIYLFVLMIHEENMQRVLKNCHTEKRILLQRILRAWIRLCCGDMNMNIVKGKGTRRRHGVFGVICRI